MNASVRTIENVLENSRLQKAYLCPDKKRTQAPDVHITFAGCQFGWGDTTLLTSLYNAMSMRSGFLKHFQTKLFS